MAVNNSLTAKTTEKFVTEYESGGEKVKLSAQTVKNYLVRGGGDVTDQELMMFLTLCKFQHLNPFLNEAYLIKFGQQPAQIVTGKEVFTKRAKRNKKYQGKQAGIIVQNVKGEIIEREGTFHTADEKVVGGWAKIFIEGYDQPEYASVSFDEVAGKKKDGELNSIWSGKPAQMVRKVALVQALREAFPEDYEGMYSPEELSEASEVVYSETDTTMPTDKSLSIEVAAIPQPIPQPEPAKVYETDDVSAALFGGSEE